MSSKRNIDREVEKTLQSLDDIERIETDYFFYSRLAAKIEKRNRKALKEGPSLGFALSMAAVVVFLFLNVISLNQIRSTNEVSTPSEEELLDEFTYGYQTLDLSYYENFEE